MQAAPVVLIAEDDEGHAILIQQTLRDAGLGNRKGLRVICTFPGKI